MRSGPRRSRTYTPADDSNKRAMTDRTFLAMMLAPTVEICEALLRGERVPVERLDPEWVARFGKRPR